MTADSRITPAPGTRSIKASKPLASSVSACAPLKRHVPIPVLKSVKGTGAKSPTTSCSSDSSSGKGRIGGKAISNPKISQGTKDAPADPRLSSSESSDETTGTEFEASNELSSETKRIIEMAAPSPSIPELQLDVVHSNMDVSWFNIDDHQLDDFLKPEAEVKHPMTSSEERQNSLSAAAEGTVTPSSIHESINSVEDNTVEDRKTVVEDLSLQTPGVIKCSDENNNVDHKYEAGSTSPEISEGKSGIKLAFENLMRQGRHGVDAFRGWRAIKVLLSSGLFMLFTVLFYVDILIEDERGTLPPPT